MRAVAACQFAVTNFQLWRSGIGGLTAFVAVTLTLWLLAPRPALHWSGVALVVALILAVSVVGMSLFRIRAFGLRWDGAQWHLGALDGSGESDAFPGRLGVAIDVGDWMLLRFEHMAAGRRRTAWLPVQRTGLEAQWHAMRCAVYSARPADGRARDAGAAADL